MTVVYFVEEILVEMAMEMPDPCSTEGLDFLQRHLESRSYINGHIASQNDAQVFAAIKCEPHDTERYVDVVRWYRHIKSLGADERKGLPQAQHEVKVLRDPQRVKKEEEVRLLMFSRCIRFDKLLEFVWHSSVSLLINRLITNFFKTYKADDLLTSPLSLLIALFSVFVPCPLMYARM